MPKAKKSAISAALLDCWLVWANIFAINFFRLHYYIS